MIRKVLHVDTCLLIHKRPPSPSFALRVHSFVYKAGLNPLDFYNASEISPNTGAPYGFFHQALPGEQGWAQTSGIGQWTAVDLFCVNASHPSSTFDDRVG